jgi:hypothetical protein
MASAATRDPGASMVVITEYEFDAEAWRARHDGGPAVSSVSVGTGGRSCLWSALPVTGHRLLDLRDGGPPGVTGLTLQDGARIDVEPSAGLQIVSALGARRVGFDGTSDIDS